MHGARCAARPRQPDRLSSYIRFSRRHAAAASGMAVSQWSIDRLTASARADLLDQSAVRMSARAFDAFARLLEEPASPEFEAFASEKTIWEQ